MATEQADRVAKAENPNVESSPRAASAKIPSSLRDSELPTLLPPVPAPETMRGQRIALTVLLFVSFLAAAYVAAPLWVGLAFGTVTAFSLQRPYRALAQRVGGGARGGTIAAAALTLSTGAVCVSSGLIAIYVMTDEMVTIVTYMQARVGASTLSEIIGPRAARFVVKMGLDPTDVVTYMHTELQKASTYAASGAATILQTTSVAVLGLIMTLITMFYVLVEWPRIAGRLERVLPLDPRHTRALILEVRDVGRSAFIGTLATALIQGALAGLGYWAFGVPRPATWGLFTALASLVPVIGTALVWAPSAGYLVMSGHALRGLLLVVWAIVVVTSLADYVIRPRIVGGSGHTHPLLMLIAILGGIEAFGLAGLIVGPVIMSLFLAVLRLYEAVDPYVDAATGKPLPGPRTTQETTTASPDTVRTKGRGLAQSPHPSPLRGAGLPHEGEG